VLPEQHGARHEHVGAPIGEPVVNRVGEVAVAVEDLDVGRDAGRLAEFGELALDRGHVGVGVGCEKGDAGHPARDDLTIRPLAQDTGRAYR
jgi:hypothetical protein